MVEAHAQGHDLEVPRDLPWDMLVTAGERLAERYDPGRVHVAERWRGRWVLAGIEAPQFGVFEPVMRRRVFTRAWEEIVPVQEAASRVGAVLRAGT